MTTALIILAIAVVITAIVYGFIRGSKKGESQTLYLGKIYAL